MRRRERITQKQEKLGQRDREGIVPFRLIRTTQGETMSFYLADCVDGMRRSVKDGSIDVVVTSPPYNIGVKYSKHNDDLPRTQYLSWMREVGKEIRRVLRDDGSFFLNMGNTPKDSWIAFDVANELRGEFILQNTIHWVKSIAIRRDEVGNYPNLVGDLAVGHFKPIVSKRFLNDCHEYLFHFTKRGDVELDKLAIGVPYQDKSNIGRWKRAEKDRRDRGNTWFIPYKTIKSRSERPHPATFPERLPEMCIRLHGLRDGLRVLDPFSGIGASALASLKLHANFVGFEIDRAYLEESLARVLGASKQKGF